MRLPIFPTHAAPATPSASASGALPWSDWEVSDWGVALLQHYFCASTPGEPVLRLVVTAEELAKAAGAPPMEAPAVCAAFLEAIQCTPEEFRAHLRPGRLVNGLWRGEGPPPFLPYLIFTCYAAATLDEAVAEEGDFRRRICELLDHPPGTSYDLEDLPTLWLALREWLDYLRRSGVPARRLELPDPGHMSRIGHSVRLAFPQRRDSGKVARIFADFMGDSAALPTVPEAFALVEAEVHQFSDDFKAVFRRAKSILIQGGDGPDLRLVWSALWEVATNLSVPQVGLTRPRFHLIAYDDARGRLEPIVVTDRLVDGGKKGITCVALPNAVEEHRHYLSNAQGSPRTIVEVLLRHGLAGDRLSLLAGSPIVRAVADGVLLFRQVDGTAWSLCTTRAREGACRALVRRDRERDLTRLVRKLLPSTVSVKHTDVFHEWDELSAFDFADIPDPILAAPELKAIRALQRVEAGEQIHLVDGLRTASGFLGTASLLPEVRCTEATEVSVHMSPEGAVQTPRRLVDRLVGIPGQPGVFRWPGPKKYLDGPMDLVASNDAGEITSRHVVFESAVLSADYRPVPDTARWLAEGGETDMVRSDAIDGFLGPRALAHARTSLALPRSGSERPTETHATGIDGDRRFDEFVEALACLGLRRHGLPEREFIAIGNALGVLDSHAALWDGIRAWLEAGYFDALTDARWRGRTYVPRRPRLVAVPMGLGRTQVVLHGLSPRIIRNRVRQSLDRGGAVEAPLASLSPCVPVPLAWSFDGDPARLEGIARAADLTLAWVVAPEALVGDLDGAFTAGASPPTSRTRLQSWDWEEAGFRSPVRTAVAQGASSAPDDSTNARANVCVHRHVRADGPDEYHVATRHGETIAVTRSRTWALLRAFSAARCPAFVALGDRYFIRAGDDGAYVPLPAARALSLWSGMLSGPAEVALLGQRYIYATRDAAQRHRILAKLSGHHLDDVDRRVLAWIHAAARGRRSRGVRVPADLRRRLEAMGDVPDAVALAELTVPPHLVPHLRRALSPASAPPSRIS